MNVAGVFRTVEKERSKLPILSNPALKSESKSKQRAESSTKADTSIVDKSLSIDYKMPRSAMPKNNFNKYLQESREELASISSVLLGAETPSVVPLYQTLEQNSGSKRIPRKATKSEVPVEAPTRKTVSQSLAENEEKVMQMLDRINYNSTLAPLRNKACNQSSEKSYASQFRSSQSPENAYVDIKKKHQRNYSQPSEAVQRAI